MSVRFRRSFSLCLLVVLSLMVLKNFVIQDHPQHGSCDEFGHLHWSLHQADSQSHEDHHNTSESKKRETECRAGQSIFAYAVVLSVPVVVPPSFELNRSWVQRPVRMNEDPVLEPRRRPPRAA